MIEALVAFLLGFGLALVLNRVRWDLFPLTGGAPFLEWMGGPRIVGFVHDAPPSPPLRPIDVTCQYCGALPGTSCVHDNGADAFDDYLHATATLDDYPDVTAPADAPRVCAVCAHDFVICCRHCGTVGGVVDVEED